MERRSITGESAAVEPLVPIVMPLPGFPAPQPEHGIAQPIPGGMVSSTLIDLFVIPAMLLVRGASPSAKEDDDGPSQSTPKPGLQMRIFLAVLVTTLVAAFPAGAQQPDSVRAAGEPFLTRRDALYAGGFLVAAAALAPLDRTLDDELQEPAYQGKRALNGGASVFRLLGVPGAGILAASAYATGRLADRPGLADAGLHTAESILLANVATGVIKNVAGRARPFVSPDDPYRFALGRGFRSGDYRSFPSGHTSTAFAAAAAATRELGHWAPRYRVPGGVVLYGGATLVGLSRMYDQKHWATDVVAGAALGTFSGWKVVSYNHRNPGNRVDRMLLHAAAVPTAEGGVMVMWSIPR
jgi:membrane-associated phospholipid phosphatase